MTEPMPVFVIKAKDRLAVEAVREYQALCRSCGLLDQGEEVGKAIDEMVAWRAANPDLVQMPDHPHVPAALSAPADDCVDLPSQATVVGRLTRSDVRQRTELVGLRLTPEECRLAKRLAADAGVTVQGLFRRAVSALSVPSEPVQDKPRVWVMPEIPEDVKGVEDRNGNTWARIGPSRSWDCTSDKGEYYRPLTSFELLRGRGPLSEVVEPDGD